MLLRLLGIKRDWTPWGTAGCLYIYIVFFYPFIVYSVWTSNLQCCSQVGHCELFTSAEEEEKKEALWNIFKSSVSHRARRLGSKGKKLHFWNSWGAGNDGVKGQQRGSLIKKKKGGSDGLRGERLIDCFLSALWPAPSVPYSVHFTVLNGCLLAAALPWQWIKYRETVVTAGPHWADKWFGFETFITRQYIITNNYNNLKES